jgi:hypothetical protein
MAIYWQEKMLAQTSSPGVAAINHYTKVASKITIIKRILITNKTALPSTYTINFANAGGAYAAANLLYFAVAIAANTTVELNTYIVLQTTAGTIGVAEGVVASLNFTSFGVEITE